MSINTDNDKKIKTNQLSLNLKTGDRVFGNDLGSTIIQTTEDNNFSSKTHIIAGRYGQRPDINEDKSSIIIGENGNANDKFNRNTPIQKDNRTGSYIIINGQKILLNSIDQNIEITSGDDINISSSDNITIKCGGNLKIDAKNISFECQGDIKIKCKSFEIDSNDIKLGKNANQPMVLGLSLDSAFKTHTHTETQLTTLPPNPTSQFLSNVIKVK